MHEQETPNNLIHVVLREAIIEKDPVYKVYRAMRNEQLIHYLRVFQFPKLKKYQMESAITAYKDAFSSITEEVLRGQNVNKVLKRTSKDWQKKNQKTGVYIGPYEESLKDYIMKNTVQEAECIFIMKQVIEAIYSIVGFGSKICNVRSENFVKIWNDPNYFLSSQYQAKKRTNTFNRMSELFRWKIDSIPESYSMFRKNKSQRPFESEFIWKESYQAPQFYGKGDLSEEEIQQSVVWSIGNIMVEILAGKNILDSQNSILQLERMAYNVVQFIKAKVNRSVTISPELQELLTKLLQRDQSKRMKLGQLFKQEFLCHNIHEYEQNRLIKSLEQIKNTRGSSGLEGAPTRMVQSVFLFKKQMQQNAKAMIKTGLSRGYSEKIVNSNFKAREHYQILIKRHQQQFKPMKDFVEDIVEELYKGLNIPVIHEEIVMLDFLKQNQIGIGKQISLKRTSEPKHMLRMKPSWSLSSQSESLDETRVKKNTRVSAHQVTKTLVSCLRPYKQQYQKTIFLSLICVRLECFQEERRQRQLKKSSGLQKPNSDFEDELYLMKYRFVTMRLIILHNLWQALTLSQNVFKIGQNIQNFHNKDSYMTTTLTQEWVLFLSSGMYNALSIFINHQKQTCFKELLALLEDRKDQSKICSKEINRMCEIPYKQRSVSSFVPHFQELGSLINQWNKQVKDTQDAQTIRMMAYLAYALSCHKVHAPDESQANFGPYIRLQSSSFVSDSVFENCFPFKDYDRFLENGQITYVSQHLKQVCQKYLLDPK